ncbi:MAG: GNAT family N-acetyltransferase [Acutalibacteraceae bacterium]|nr:GNAT family N-acetyltransferase [Oscillospiraceae bacterium]
MIRKIEKRDSEEYLKMAKDFYSSSAVLHPVPEEYFKRTLDEMLTSDRYAEGYILEKDGETAGYALVAKTFSQEAGGLVIWAEELYIKPEFRSHGLGTEFFRFLEENRSSDVKRIRLEVELENAGAIKLYKRLGYDFLEYNQMIKEF